jgi:hypothetical protein
MGQEYVLLLLMIPLLWFTFLESVCIIVESFCIITASFCIEFESFNIRESRVTSLFFWLQEKISNDIIMVAKIIFFILLLFKNLKCKSNGLGCFFYIFEQVSAHFLHTAAHFLQWFRSENFSHSSAHAEQISAHNLQSASAKVEPLS